MAKDEGLTYSKATEWQGGYSNELEQGGEQPPGVATKAAAGYQWVRIVTTCERFRIAEGVRYFSSQIGETATAVIIGSRIYVQNNDDTFRADSINWECVHDDCFADPPGSGFNRHRQVWEYRGAWREEVVS